MTAEPASSKTTPNNNASARGLNQRLPLTLVVAWRYMLGRRSKLLSSTALAALLSTALGVMAMVIALALMTGYTEDLQRKLIGLQGEILVSPLEIHAIDDHRDVLAAAADLSGVERMTRVAYGEGSIASKSVPESLALVLRGVDPRTDPNVVDPSQLEPDAAGIPGILLGEELARQLAAEPGEVLRLVILVLGDKTPSFRYRSVRVGGTFTSGFAQFDNSWALIAHDVLSSARGERGFDLIEFKLEDPTRTSTVTRQIDELLGADFIVSSWQRLNRELFAALALQELLLFLVLGLIVLVSTFNVASTLVILVRERRRDIGILLALGLDRRHLWWIFSLYGLFLGAVGTLLGIAVGSGASWVLTEFKLVRFGPEIAAIYFIDSVPFQVEFTDILAITVFALLVTLAACSLPAFRAARILPANALHDE